MTMLYCTFDWWTKHFGEETYRTMMEDEQCWFLSWASWGCEEKDAKSFLREFLEDNVGSHLVFLVLVLILLHWLMFHSELVLEVKIAFSLSCTWHSSTGHQVVVREGECFTKSQCGNLCGESFTSSHADLHQAPSPPPSSGIQHCMNHDDQGHFPGTTKEQPTALNTYLLMIEWVQNMIYTSSPNIIT